MLKYKPIAASALLALILAGPVQAMSPGEARDIVQPFYDFLSNSSDSAAADAARGVFHPDWQSFYSNSDSKGLDQTIEAIAGFGKVIPDLEWTIKDVKVAGDTIVVRGEATGTPAGEVLGVPHSGNDFRIMSIDMHTVKDGRIVKSYHIEDWAGAMRQLSAAQ